MTQGFDEWYSNPQTEDFPSLFQAFNAGAASRQAEVDELKRRIDKIENHININYDCEREDDNHSYWSGYNQAMREMNIILYGEGESNE